MKNIRVASLLVVGMIALSACSLGGPKPVSTVSTQGTAAAAKPAAGTPAATTVNKSALPAGGDVPMTPTPTMTNTTPVTPTAPITPSTDVTVTSGMTPTVEVTPTGTTTVTTTSTDQKSDIPSVMTDIKTLTTKGTVNIRNGPAATYKVVGFVRRGQTLDVTGVSKDMKWWHVKCLTGTSNSCWIIADARWVTANK
jgi:uncharacterized protein YgiM (DUF1202 family)